MRVPLGGDTRQQQQSVVRRDRFASEFSVRHGTCGVPRGRPVRALHEAAKQGIGT